MSKKNNIKVGVIGMGPVGMILASKLQESGCEVGICVRNKVKFNKIKEEGITLENVFKSVTRFDRIYGSIQEMESFKPDFLIFALKSYQTQQAAEEAEVLNSENLTVISAQNGIDVEGILCRSFGESKTLRLVLNFGGNTISPNVVKVSFFMPPNYLGSVDDSKSEAVKIFAAYLNKAGLETIVVDSFEIVKRAWEKTILNASLSSLCGVGRLTMEEAVSDPDTRELIEQIINEGVEVAEKEKIFFPDSFVKECLRYLKKGGDHFPSLALDLINNRKTEIDYVNGKIVEYGKKHYIRTSLNLAFTNMVKAMTNKNVLSRMPGVVGEELKKLISKGLADKNKSPLSYKNKEVFLGIDLGSAYTKFTIIDNDGDPVFRYILQTLNKDKSALKNVIRAIHMYFNVKYSCATGYGRKHFTEADMIKTEINCAALGGSKYYKGEKNIIDVGGEDIKIIRCDKENHVSNFYMNDKCAAGTGAFITEIAERAEINIAEMSSLASHSDYNKELNSFCTVFAKTEIMNWILDGIPVQDTARGIYISIANKIAKMRLDSGIPTLMIGGVIAHHPYLKSLLGEKFDKEIKVLDYPQYVVSLGAALMARQYSNNKDS